MAGVHKICLRFRVTNDLVTKTSEPYLPNLGGERGASVRSCTELRLTHLPDAVGTLQRASFPKSPAGTLPRAQ